MKKTLLSFVCALAVIIGAQSVIAADSPAFKNPATHKVAQEHQNFGRRPKGPLSVSPEQAQKMQKEMDDKLASKLNLTDEQRVSAEKIRADGRAKMKPLMEQMKDIRRQMDEIRKQNMNEFENILTPDQKQAFEKMKQDKKDHPKMKHKKRPDKMKKHRPDQEI